MTNWGPNSLKKLLNIQTSELADIFANLFFNQILAVGISYHQEVFLVWIHYNSGNGMASMRGTSVCVTGGFFCESATCWKFHRIPSPYNYLLIFQTSIIVHTFISIQNTNAHEVLSDSHKYFTFVSHIFSSHPSSLMYSFFNTHIYIHMFIYTYIDLCMSTYIQTYLSACSIHFSGSRCPSWIPSSMQFTMEWHSVGSMVMRHSTQVCWMVSSLG